MVMAVILESDMLQDSSPFSVKEQKLCGLD